MINIRQFVRCSMMFLGLLISLLIGLFVGIQPADAQDDTKFTGTVVSSSRNTVTVRTSEGRYQLFTFAARVRKPQAIPIGSQVQITSVPTEESSVRSATEVIVLPPASGGAGTSQAQPPVVPPEVRGVERDIERAARRFQLGVRGGVALDPELILIGAHAQIGPFFSSNVFFRPNVEFAYGELTALFAINPEVIYRLPLTSRYGRWSSYFGMGPGFNFTHQNFERATGGPGGSRIDFGDFNSETALNILGGLRYRSGLFTEIKASIYAAPSPTFRLIVGYNF